MACRCAALPCYQRNVDHYYRLTVSSDDSQMKTLHVLSPLYFMGRLPCSKVNSGLFIHSLCLHDWQKSPILFFCYFTRKKKPLQGLLHSAFSNFISLSLNTERSKAVSESSCLITFHFSGSRNEHLYCMSKYIWLDQVLKYNLWFLSVYSWKGVKLNKQNNVLLFLGAESHLVKST